MRSHAAAVLDGEASSDTLCALNGSLLPTDGKPATPSKAKIFILESNRTVEWLVVDPTFARLTASKFEEIFARLTLICLPLFWFPSRLRNWYFSFGAWLGVPLP